MDRYDDFIFCRGRWQKFQRTSTKCFRTGRVIGRVEGDIDEFTKLAHHLQDEITAREWSRSARSIRDCRGLRDAANFDRQHVEMDLSGAKSELDNNIIQQISDPLVHLVRNSVAHGIEQVLDRVRQEKSPAAISRCAPTPRNHIYIEVEDDGGGINYSASSRAQSNEAGFRRNR